MRILRLRLCNLNSLQGVMEVDFTRPPLSQGGLFAITGQTGAGKTTLLDAITLALYGRAARYGSTASPETIMSRHTGEAWAEVEFSCASGSFRSLWQRQRAHRKPEGKLQNPRRQVVALPSGEILTEKIPEAERKIPELTGLDYDRFLRSVLLAQGEFTSFLKADVRERTELLQEVTGTAIYREISELAYKRADQARKACEGLQRDQQSVRLLDETARQGALQQLESARRACADQQALIATLGSRMEQARRWQECEREQRETESARESHARECAQEAASLQRLAGHERALPLRVPLAELEREQLHLKSEQEALAKARNGVPPAESALDTAGAELLRSRQELTAEEQTQISLSALWLEIEERDRLLAASAEAGRQLANRAAEAQQRHGKAEKQAAEHAGRLAGTRSRESVEVAWLAEHEPEGRLAAQLGALQEGLSRWNAGEARLAELRAERDQVQAGLSRHREAATFCAAEIEQLRRTLAQRRDAESSLRATIEQEAQGLGAEQLEGLIEEARRRHSLCERLCAEADQLRSQSQAVEAARQEEIRAGVALVEASRAVEACRKQSDTVAALVDARRTALSLAETLQSLEQHRAHLSEGKPCPLCGSLHHPYASPSALPSAEVGAARKALKTAEQEQYDAADALSKAEKLEATWQEKQGRLRHELPRNTGRLEKALEAWTVLATSLKTEVRHSDEAGLRALLNETRMELNARSGQLAGMRARGKILAGLLAQVAESREQLARAEAEQQRFQSLAAELGRTLQPLQEKIRECELGLEREAAAFRAQLPADAPAASTIAEARACLELLRGRAEAYAAHRENLLTLRAELQALQAGAESLDRQLRESGEHRTALQEELARARESHARKADERRQLFGDKKPPEEREAAALRLKQLNAALSGALEREALARQNLAALQQEVARLTQSKESREAAVLNQRTTLEDSARKAGFGTLSLLAVALLPEEQAAALQGLRRRLEDRTAALQARMESLASRRLGLPPQAEGDLLALPELQARRAEAEETRDAHNREIGRLVQVIAEDDAQRLRQTAVLARIDEANREYSRWQELNALIGSADGSAFARFAQGLTLDRLALLANRHLLQLNPRYSMRRAAGEAGENLALEIVDHYQADATRPMNSLSGGESFLASLSLSLALSELAGGHTSIESLFIDEGFGSLDADTLEVAMSALENLQAQGKTIGVISHVESMKERIPVQIQVLKMPGGHSRLRLLPENT